MARDNLDTPDVYEHDMEDLRDDLPEPDARAILSALSCAESCETRSDFNANIAEALGHAESLVSELEDILKRARKRLV